MCDAFKRCLDEDPIVPSYTRTWCTPPDPITGYKALPVTKIGGHACCKDVDLCNKELDPVLWDYRTKHPVVYDAEGLRRDFFERNVFSEWIF